MGHVNVLGKHPLKSTLKFPYWKVTLEKGFPPLGISSGDWIDDIFSAEQKHRSAVSGGNVDQATTYGPR